MTQKTSQTINWPTFFVVGAAKAGTSSLYFHLQKHPQIFLPTNKEPRYFTPQVKESVSLEEYGRLYRDAGKYAASGDLSANYLLFEDVPQKIHDVCPAAKIIIMMRDPVARSFSDFSFAQTLGIEPETSFMKAIQRYEDRSSKEWYLSRYYIEQGMYYASVRRYQETFGRDQVLVLLFEDLSRNPQEMFCQIATHIGVDSGVFQALDLTEPYNQYRMPKARGLVNFVRALSLQKLIPDSFLQRVRPLFFDTKKPRLDDESRQLLQTMYEPDVARMEDLLGRKLPELRKSWK